MTENTPTPPEPDQSTPLETAQAQFERERLSRRQALKKFGMTSAMATFALFSVDDLARMVGGAMERQARNSKIAAQVAQEFQHSGIALGDVMPNPSYYPYTDPYSNPSYYPYYTYITCAAEGCKNLGECRENITNSHSGAFLYCASCGSTEGHPCAVEVFNCTAPYYNGNVSCQDCCISMLKLCQQANYGGCDSLNTGCMKRCGAT